MLLNKHLRPTKKSLPKKPNKIILPLKNHGTKS